MRKRTFFFAILSLSLLSGPRLVLAQEAAPLPRSTPVVSAGGASAVPDVSREIASYEKVLHAGELLEAKKQLKRIIKKTERTKQQRRFKKELYDLNIRILLSNIMTSDSIQYEVKPGDTIGGIARKHNTTISLVKISNGLSSDIIHPGQKLKIHQGTFRIEVDKSQNWLRLYSDNELVKEYPVATGRANGTPVGTFTIDTKLENPTWYHAGAVVPPDSPKNILGTRWLGWDKKGFGIHGTTIPESIGKQATSGCVRMRNTDVEELYGIVPYGTKVSVQD